MIKALAVFTLLAVSFGTISCNALATAQNFSNVLGGIIAVAQADIPALPPADGAILTTWTNLGVSLDGQLNTCIGALGNSGKTAQFLGCFNAFASGLLNPTELAQLRIVSAGSQSKVQLYVTAAVLGLNAALVFYKGVSQTPPVVGSGSTPSAEDLRTTFLRAGVTNDQLFQYGF